MAQNNADDRIAMFLKSSNPDVFAGWNNDKVVQYAREKDPGFDQYARKFYGSPIVSNGPLNGIVNATQPIRDAVGNLIKSGDESTVGKLANSLYPTAAAKGFNSAMSELSLSAENASDALATKKGTSGASSMYRTLSYALGLAQVPESVTEAGLTLATGGALAAVGDSLFGAKEIRTPEVKSYIPPSDSTSFNTDLSPKPESTPSGVQAIPTKEQLAMNPTTGKVETIKVPDAKALAQSNQLLPVEDHAKLAQGHVQQMLDASKSYIDHLWDDTNNEIENNPDWKLDTTKVSSLANKSRELISAAPEFQTSAMKKMLNTFGYDPTPEAPGDLSQSGKGWGTDHPRASSPPASNEQMAWHELEPLGTETELKTATDLAQSLGQIAAKNYKNPTGHLAGELQDALRESIKRDAPENVSKAYFKAIEASADHYKTFFNDSPVQKFLDAGSSKASGFATSDPDVLAGIRRAGGEVAIEHLRRAEGSKLLGNIVSGNMDGDAVRSLLYKNRGLDHLLSGSDYTDMSASRFAEIADKRTELIAKKAELEAVDKAQHSATAEDLTMEKRHQQEREALVQKQKSEISLNEQRKEAIDRTEQIDKSEEWLKSLNDANAKKARELTTKQKVLQAAKHTAITGGAAAIGGAVGGLPGAVGGAAIGAGLTDLLGK